MKIGMIGIIIIVCLIWAIAIIGLRNYVVESGGFRAIVVEAGKEVKEIIKEIEEE